MRVNIQLQEDAALELQQGGASSTSGSSEVQVKTKELLEAASELGVRLEPLHPGQTHPLLAPYFMAEVPDREIAEKVINRLSQFPIVEAAYIKPDEELP